MVNLAAMRKRKEEAASKRGGAEYYQVPVGENLIYVCPPLAGDELPFVETAIHYDVGPDKKMAMCLDEERNLVLKDDRIKAILSSKGKDISDGCQVCSRLDEGAQVGQEAQSRYYFAIVPLKFRKNVNKKWREADDVDELRILSCGYTVWSGITDIFINNGDISNPNQAILVSLVREGTGMKTKYVVSADADSVRAGGVKLSKSVRALIKKAIQEGETGDLYRIVGNSIRSSAEVHAMVEGVPLEEDGDDEDEDKNPECFGLDFEADDDDCDGCDCRAECAKECSPPGDVAPESEDDDSKDSGEGDDEGNDEEVGEELEVKDCVIGQWYTETSDADEIVPMKFTGTSKKGKKTVGFFELDSGDRTRLNADDIVYDLPEPDEDEDDEGSSEATDDDMAALDKAIADRKKAKEPAKPKTPGKSKGKGKSRGKRKK